MDKLYWDYLYLKDGTTELTIIPEQGELNVTRIIQGQPSWRTLRGMVYNYNINPDWKDIMEEFNRRLSN